MKVFGFEGILRLYRGKQHSAQPFQATNVTSQCTYIYI